LSIAASSSLNGGTNRVFVLPGIDAFAMTAIAQVERKRQHSPSPADISTSLEHLRTVKSHSPRNKDRVVLSTARHGSVDPP
jgi:hypothetical protein